MNRLVTYGCAWAFAMILDLIRWLLILAPALALVLVAAGLTTRAPVVVQATRLLGFERGFLPGDPVLILDHGPGVFLRHVDGGAALVQVHDSRSHSGVLLRVKESAIAHGVQP